MLVTRGWVLLLNQGAVGDISVEGLDTRPSVDRIEKHVYTDYSAVVCTGCSAVIELAAMEATPMVDGHRDQGNRNIEIGEPVAKSWTDVWLIILAVLAGPTAYVVGSRLFSSITDLASTLFR